MWREDVGFRVCVGRTVPFRVPTRRCEETRSGSVASRRHRWAISTGGMNRRMEMFRPLKNGSLVILSAALIFLMGSALAEEPDNDPCALPGQWLESEGGVVQDTPPLLRDLATQAVVLLGESHTNPEHHRWQLHTVAALHVINPRMMLGFEAFPRRVQPILDRWVAGELGEAEFLEAVNWDQVWGYDAELYLPLFHFARHYRVSMLALNVERELVSQVASEGWEAVSAKDREGLSKPADASDDYRTRLAEIFQEKSRRRHGQHSEQGSQEAAESEPESLADVLTQPGFRRFVEAQLTWDRAMAEAAADHDEWLVVGIMGRGHVAYGDGVAHQLRALGVDEVKTLLPLEMAEVCKLKDPGIADVVFVVPDWLPLEPDRPLLGVMIEAHDKGVRVAGVSANSVAEEAGIETGDVITRAAGQALQAPGDLVRLIKRQAPGTWLPLRVLRSHEEMEIVARFPPDERTPH